MAPGKSKPAAALLSPLLLGTLSGADAVRDYARVEPTERGADIVEVRLDLIPQGQWNAVFSACDRLESSGTQVLSTIRLQAEGGSWTGGDEARKAIFLRALDHSSWVDVEASSKLARFVCSEAHKRGRKALVSSHDFSTTPSRAKLEKLYSKSLGLGADIVKVATMPTKNEHHVALVGLVSDHASEKKLCAIGMGAFGLPLRIYLPTIGSMFAYAYIDKHSAPGQLSCSHMLDMLRLQIPRFNEKYLARTKSLEAA